MKDKLYTVLALLLVVGLVSMPALIFRPVQAADDGRVDQYSDGWRLGSDGTKLDLIAVGSLTILSGNTSSAAMITNMIPTDYAIVTPTDTIANASYWYTDKSTTGTLKVILSAGPSANCEFDYFVVGTP